MRYLTVMYRILIFTVRKLEYECNEIYKRSAKCAEKKNTKIRKCTATKTLKKLKTLDFLIIIVRIFDDQSPSRCYYVHPPSSDICCDCYNTILILCSHGRQSNAVDPAEANEPFSKVVRTTVSVECRRTTFHVRLEEIHENALTGSSQMFRVKMSQI